jgi:chromosomal replication initiation ATPase DnaA
MIMTDTTSRRAAPYEGWPFRAHKPLACAAIIAEVAAQFSLSIEQIRGRIKTRKYVDARRAVIWRLVITEPNYLGVAECGRELDLDHSTVIYHLRVLAKEIGEAYDLKKLRLRFGERSRVHE